MTLQSIIAYFESLDPAALDRLPSVYAEDATFKDPFNDVGGVEAIRAVYAHMFQTLVGARFRVTASFAGADGAMLLWDFTYDGVQGRTRTPMRIRGATHLRFAADGRIAAHRDYWDVAEELYETVPLLGGVLRWIKRRLRAPTPSSHPRA